MLKKRRIVSMPLFPFVIGAVLGSVAVYLLKKNKKSKK
jgi:uncharacterized membrane protein YcaP (DUF421 family)